MMIWAASSEGSSSDRRQSIRLHRSRSEGAFCEFAIWLTFDGAAKQRMTESLRGASEGTMPGRSAAASRRHSLDVRLTKKFPEICEASEWA